MFKKLIFSIFLVFILTSCAFSEDISGIYREGSSNLGILIEQTAMHEGYMVYRVFLNSTGEIRQKFEWQSAYIPSSSMSELMFYWKTGRVEDSIPESNKLIVYELTIENENLIGLYFFPEEPRTPTAEVRFIKIKD